MSMTVDDYLRSLDSNDCGVMVRNPWPAPMLDGEHYTSAELAYNTPRLFFKRENVHVIASSIVMARIISIEVPDGPNRLPNEIVLTVASIDKRRVTLYDPGYLRPWSKLDPVWTP